MNDTQENILIAERSAILEILNIKNNTLKTIIRKKQLKERLNEKGYILLEEFKEGRKTLYKLEHYGELSDNKFKLNNAMKRIFNTTKDENKHTDYIMYRCANIYKPLSKKHLAEKLGVNEKTIRKWDNNMLYNNLLAKDGYFYLSMDFKEDGFDYRLTDKNEYNSFIHNNAILKVRQKAKEKYKSDEMSDEEFEVVMNGTTKQLEANYGKVVYKVSKYTLGKDSDLTKIILKLIKDVWNKKLFDYILDYLPSELKNKKTVEDYLNELV